MKKEVVNNSQGLEVLQSGGREDPPRDSLETQSMTAPQRWKEKWKEENHLGEVTRVLTMGERWKCAVP